MRKLICWFLLVAALVLAPSSALAQTDTPPVFTGFLSHPNYDQGGPFVAIQFVYMKTNRPFYNQVVGYRGFNDLDGAVTGVQNQWVGSKEEALSTNMLYGPGSWQPGWDLFVGYRFVNGMVIEAQWRHLVQARYTAQAAIIPPNFNVGAKFENTFISALVSNFTTDWAGNDINIPVGTNATTFGIWNAASLMQIEHVQRYDIYGLNVRMPIWQTEGYRSYGTLSPRIVWIFDRFSWRTVDQDETGAAAPETIANYSNTVSNRLYGLHLGSGHDWFLGSTPIGGFAATLEIEGGLSLDMAKTRVAWEREDGALSMTRGRRFYPLSPSVGARAGLWWYPWEGISMQVSYDFQAYFNTVASHRPVDFNMGTVDPEFNCQFFRHFHGLRFGINFVF